MALASGHTTASQVQSFLLGIGDRPHCGHWLTRGLALPASSQSLCACTEGVAELGGLCSPCSSPVASARSAADPTPARSHSSQSASERALASTLGKEGSSHAPAPAPEPGVAWCSRCALGCHCRWMHPPQHLTTHRDPGTQTPPATHVFPHRVPHAG